MPLSLPIAVAERFDARYGSPLPKGTRRRGVMFHFDGSSSDRGGLRYLNTSALGYTWAIGDDGALYELEDPELKTPHAGRCLTPSANSVYWGVAFLTNERQPVTHAARNTALSLAAALWRHEQWGEASHSTVLRRIRGHDEEAIYGPEHTKNQTLWGRLGRKCDPTGLPKGPVILSMRELRTDLLTDLLTMGVR